MTSQRAVPWVAAVLALLGFITIALRASQRGQAALEKGDSLWRVRYLARFQATRAGAKLQIFLPSDTEHARIFHEDVLYADMSAHRLRSARLPARQIALVARRRARIP